MINLKIRRHALIILRLKNEKDATFTHQVIKNYKNIRTVFPQFNNSLTFAMFIRTDFSCNECVAAIIGIIVCT